MFTPVSRRPLWGGTDNTQLSSCPLCVGFQQWTGVIQTWSLLWSHQSSPVACPHPPVLPLSRTNGPACSMEIRHQPPQSSHTAYLAPLMAQVFTYIHKTFCHLYCKQPALQLDQSIPHLTSGFLSGDIFYLTHLSTEAL